MQIINNPSRKEWADILKRPTMRFDEIEKKVQPIMERIRLEGRSAVAAFSAQFDGIAPDPIAATPEEINAAADLVSDELKAAIRQAAKNIETFHRSQLETVNKVETMPGVVCWRKSVGIEKVGLYIPGGTAPLFSTVLMLGIPANLAGCKEIVLCTPPNKQGNIHPAILFAASVVGITEVFKVGGAQAIAALTYGTEDIPAVYKIFGPGNQYVMAAKQMATKAGVAIDMPAGPSEVAVLADHTANPAFVAADLLSQAEHGADSQVVLVTTDASMPQRVAEAVAQQLEQLPRKDFADKALANSKTIYLPNLPDAIEMINAYAAEHLILSVDNAEAVGEQIVNAGSIFLGHYTPESAGDYASGTNHTLPTDGYARNYSGVSVDSFVRKITFQQISREGIQLLGPTVEVMAAAEELFAHKNAVTLRREAE